MGKYLNPHTNPATAQIHASRSKAVFVGFTSGIYRASESTVASCVSHLVTIYAASFSSSLVALGLQIEPSFITQKKLHYSRHYLHSFATYSMAGCVCTLQLRAKPFMQKYGMPLPLRPEKGLRVTASFSAFSLSAIGCARSSPPLESKRSFKITAQINFLSLPSPSN